ncbi:hypothetical protein STAFG_3649 [Streptomyces afghaniensis 772]|uniref:Uncharacterized protein n=1 Tax=Streptomyces afghaniensis 772 TaxID=1283301 RepID=S4MZF7_9ACTN|nr:hypothetical protein STAFG_3649 [Streptomyces afghaniensis 772]
MQARCRKTTPVGHDPTAPVKGELGLVSTHHGLLRRDAWVRQPRCVGAARSRGSAPDWCYGCGGG